MASSEPDRSSSAPPQQQSSQTYHTSTKPSNANPYLSPTRPRIDNSSSAQSTGTNMADRVRSLSTSSLMSPPLLSSETGQKPDAVGSIGESLRQVRTSNAAAQQPKKDMFQWFQDTVVISMIVRNWPN